MRASDQHRGPARNAEQDASSEAALRYWIDRYPMGAATLLSQMRVRPKKEKPREPVDAIPPRPQGSTHPDYCDYDVSHRPLRRALARRDA